MESPDAERTSSSVASSCDTTTVPSCITVPPHASPSKPPAAGAWITVTCPSASVTRFRPSSAKKYTASPPGVKKGACAPSVPLSTRTSNRVSERTYSFESVPWPAANTSNEPSGESASMALPSAAESSGWITMESGRSTLALSAGVGVAMDVRAASQPPESPRAAIAHAASAIVRADAPLRPRTCTRVSARPACPEASFASSAVVKSAAVANRSAGSFASARSTAVSTPGGIVFRTSDGGSGSRAHHLRHDRLQAWRR